MRATTVTPNALVGALRSSGRLYLNKVDGVLWATDSYWAVEVPDDKHPVALLLADYNLPREPLCSVVARTVRRNDAEPPEMEKLVRSVSDGLAPIKPASIAGVPLLVDRDRTLCAVYEHPDGSYATFNVKFLELVAALAPRGGEWQSAGPLKPAAWVVEGAVKALLMPVRSALTDATWQTPKKPKRAA